MCQKGNTHYGSSHLNDLSRQRQQLFAFQKSERLYPDISETFEVFRIIVFQFFAGLSSVPDFHGILPSTAGGILGANIGARLLSAVYNYTMNCHFVFHEKQSVRTGSEYIALAGFILMLNNLILEFLTMILEIPVYPAKILTEITLFLVSWLVQKKLIFGKRKEPGSSPKEEFKKNLKTYRGIFNEGCYSSKKRNQEA